MTRRQPPRRPPTTRRADLSWLDRGNCAGYRSPDDGRYFTDLTVDEQKRVCRRDGGCPVVLQCLEYGLAGPPVYAGRKATDGVVYGGLGPRELGRLQRERAGIR